MFPFFHQVGDEAAWRANSPELFLDWKRWIILAQVQPPKIIMTGLKLIPLIFSSEIDIWGQKHCVLLCLRMLQMQFHCHIDNKMAAGHQQKDRNPYWICLIMNVPKHYPSQKRSPGREIWVPIDFLKQESFHRPSAVNWRCLSPLWAKVWPLQRQTCTCESLGYQYDWKKLLKVKKNLCL